MNNIYNIRYTNNTMVKINNHKNKYNKGAPFLYVYKI